jgi:hypothetical protein
MGLNSRKMQEENPFVSLDAGIMSKIIASIPLRFVVGLRFVCKQFNFLMSTYMEYVCSDMVQCSPKQQPLIDSTEDQNCLFRLYDLYFHKLIDIYGYDKYKTRLGFTDDYLQQFYGDTFRAFGSNLPRIPPYKKIYKETGGYYEESAFSISLVNFIGLFTVNSRYYFECRPILRGLSVMSNKLQYELVRHFPGGMFCTRHIFKFKLSVEVMISLGDKVTDNTMWINSVPAEDCHLYLRSLIPFYDIHGAQLLPLFLAMGQHMFGPWFCEKNARFGDMDPEEFESVVLAIASLRKISHSAVRYQQRDSYKKYFSDDQIIAIEARLAELEQQKPAELLQRDISPKRKSQK